MAKELIIYGKDNCPQCNTLKLRLAHDEIPYTYLNLNTDYGIKDLMEIKPIDVKSFPVSFIKETHWHWGTVTMTHINNEDIMLSTLFPQESIC